MKSLFLLRGLPGSGKSTAAGILSEGSWPVFSVDDYFTDPVTKVYEFRYDENHKAYAHCQERTADAMKKGMDKIFIDNTFTLEWELEPYFKLAAEHGYRVFCFTVENRHHGTNTHDIPDEQVRKMAEKYKVILV
jgi:predicted kinase